MIDLNGVSRAVTDSSVTEWVFLRTGPSLNITLQEGHQKWVEDPKKTAAQSHIIMCSLTETSRSLQGIALGSYICTVE